MSVVSKKTITKYVEMCSQSGRVWSETDIVSFRSLINTKLSDQDETRGMLFDLFLESIDKAPFKLDGAHEAKGVAWLLRTQVNSKGELRDAKTTFINEYELAVIRDFDSMVLTGLRDPYAYTNVTGYKSFVPIYRVVARCGAWFEYTEGRGGAMEVTNIGRPAAPPMLRSV